MTIAIKPNWTVLPKERYRKSAGAAFVKLRLNGELSLSLKAIELLGGTQDISILVDKDSGLLGVCASDTPDRRLSKDGAVSVSSLREVFPTAIGHRLPVRLEDGVLIAEVPA